MKKGKKTFFGKWDKKFRLILLSDETYEERFSFQLTRGNLYILFSTLVLTCMLVSASLIIYTPLREYIPGYGNAEMKYQLSQMKVTTDSLKQVVEMRDVWVDGVRKAISGEIKPDSIFNHTH